MPSRVEDLVLAQNGDGGCSAQDPLIIRLKASRVLRSPWGGVTTTHFLQHFLTRLCEAFLGPFPTNRSCAAFFVMHS